MSIEIIITDKIRSLSAYFSDLKEESAVIPDRPWLREILEMLTSTPGSNVELESKLLSPENLQTCITTCIYFDLNSSRFAGELFWNIASNKELFASYYRYIIRASVEADSKENLVPLTPLASEKYILTTEIPEPLRFKLAASWGLKCDRQEMIKLGARCIEPSCVEIAASGNMRLLQWAWNEWKFCSDEEKQKKPYRWNRETFEAAASGGHLEVLKYLYVTCYLGGTCPWDKGTCEAAASGMTALHFACLKYAHQNGCSWGIETCEAAARSGHLECLKYAHQNRLSWNVNVCYFAVGGSTEGHFACLVYAHQNGCPWDRWTCSNAAKRGNLKQLKYAHENGCPWDVQTCSSAAGGKTKSHFECLVYAHENGCPWDAQTCSSAAGEGVLNCLRYAHENGCPWDEATCSNAVCEDTKNHFECFKYAHENGCPWNKEIYIIAANAANLTCLKYARENGCPQQEDAEQLSSPIHMQE